MRLEERKRGEKKRKKEKGNGIGVEEENGAEKNDASSWFLRLVLSLRDIRDNERDRADLIKKLNSFSMLITATRCTTRVYLNVR